MHKTRPIIATQFHPEVPGGTVSLSTLVDGLDL
jgi:anthranilate/para-aminobenzoate synthase component II